MNFESLPNELILDIFEYLNVIHLFHTFYNLNLRLNDIINKSIQTYHLNFQFISKYEYDSIYQQYRRFIDHKVVSIAIADEDETPHLPQIFFSNSSFNPSSFLYLHSCSFYSIHSIDLLNNIILHCQSLPHLARLQFIQCLLNDVSRSMINSIWTIPTLIDLCIDENMSRGTSFSQISSTSSTIKYLSIKHVNCDLQSLSNICQRTPYLKQLSIKLTSTSKSEKLPTIIPHLTHLTLSFYGSSETLINLLQSMIKLRYLTLQTTNLLLNGHQWKDILINSLPNLRRFQLKMSFQFPLCDDLEDKIDQLLDTFQTDFWLNKHQWFVRCDWNPIDPFNQVNLYTLPYAFNDFHFHDELHSKSTCPKKLPYSSYKQVQILQYESDISHHTTYLSISFPTITHLVIFLPFNENFLSHLPTFHHLISLDVTLLPDEIVYHQLQLLLNHAPNLYLLRFSHLSELDMKLFQLKNSSLCRLDFFTKESMLYNWYFNHEQCVTLANSSLGQQLKTLIIDIKKRLDILELIHQMSNLQALICQCKDDKISSISTTNDEFIQWLYEHLPSACTVFRDQNQTSIVQIWIR